jgi:hypothetical protein
MREIQADDLQNPILWLSISAVAWAVYRWLLDSSE